MQLHVAILILKFAYSGDGTQMLSKVIFAFLAFHTVLQHTKCYFSGSNLVAGWKGTGLGGRAVCRGNCSALGFCDILFFPLITMLHSSHVLICPSSVQGPLLTLTWSTPVLVFPLPYHYTALLALSVFIVYRGHYSQARPLIGFCSEHSLFAATSIQLLLNASRFLSFHGSFLSPSYGTSFFSPLVCYCSIYSAYNRRSTKSPNFEPNFELLLPKQHY